MSKSKFAKILIAALSLCLLVCLAFGVTAFASGNEGESGAYTKPVISSKNVEYSSQTYLHYAVPVESVPEADRAVDGLWLNVLDAEGKKLLAVAPVTNDNGELAITNVNGIACYTFRGRGVPAKELNTVEYTEVETKSGAKSDICSYSVEEYLYHKLYTEGFVAETEADNASIGKNDRKDYARRTLYYDLLKYGAIAQELLAPGAEDKIGDSSYLDVKDAIAKGGFVTNDRINLVYNGANADQFDAWSFVQYDAWGDIVNSGYAMNGATFLGSAGYLKASPVFANIPDLKEEFNGDTLPTKWSYAGGASVGTNPKDANDKVLHIDASVSGHTNIFYVAEKIADATVAVIEGDFYWDFSDKKAEIYVYPNMGDGSTTNCMQMFYIGKSDVTCYKNGGDDTTFGASGVVSGRWVNIRIEYRVVEIDGAKLPEFRFYVDGVLKDVTHELRGKNYYTDGVINSSKIPSPGEVDRFKFFFSSTVTSGNIYIDDFNFVHGTSVATNYINPESNFIDFNSDYESGLSISCASNFIGTTMGEASKNTWEVLHDEASGDGYLRLYKYGVDSPEYNGGAALIPKVTYTEDGYNTFVFEADLHMSNVKGFASEIIICNSGITGTKNAPFLFSIPKVYNEWIHLVITYRPTKVDSTGKVLEFESSIKYVKEDGTTVNHDSYKATAETAYGANIKNGNTTIPALKTNIYMKFGFNNNFNGDVMVDNVGIQLLNIVGNNPVVVSE